MNDNQQGRANPMNGMAASRLSSEQQALLGRLRAAGSLDVSGQALRTLRVLCQLGLAAAENWDTRPVRATSRQAGADPAPRWYHRHPQVKITGMGITCDQDIAVLIRLINACGVTTIMSCQDNSGRRRGGPRRIWVEIELDDLVPLLALLIDDGEQGIESLSNRIAGDREPDDWAAFRADRAWHYDLGVSRFPGGLLAVADIRFPYTDLAEVTRRLQAAGREAGGCGQ